MPAEETPVPIAASPADRIAAAVERYGERDVVERAITLLGGGDESRDFLLFVGGAHANGILNGAPALYWPELWGARVFMYLWDDSATASIRAGMGNRAWRVREMCAKVVALQRLPFAEALEPLLADEVPRVRAAAALALGSVVAAGSVDSVDRVDRSKYTDSIRALLGDPDIEVRRQANTALTRLEGRSAGPAGPRH